jgi:hypothetical protein
MSLRCSEHGWGVGELGCHECDEKNNSDNPIERVTVQFGRMSEEMNKSARVFDHYYRYQIMDPSAAVKIVSVV